MTINDLNKSTDQIQKLQIQRIEKLEAENLRLKMKLAEIKRVVAEPENMQWKEISAAIYQIREIVKDVV